MSQSTLLEVLLRRDRVIVIAGLITIIVLTWAYTLLGVGMGMTAFDMTFQRDAIPMVPMSGMPGDSTAGMAPHTESMATDILHAVAWTPGYALLMVAMWAVMMTAMMLPSAAPMILLFAAVNRKQREQAAPYVPTISFMLGYIIAWGAFSVLATALQWALQQSALLSPMMVNTSTIFGGVLLVAAGLYQLTPVKHACLRHCRSPFSFVMHHWRPGRRGAFIMGLEHGMYCLGCCWILMGLLFFGGVMNLVWIAGLAVFVLIEKTLPAGHWVGSAAGVALIVWGATLLVA